MIVYLIIFGVTLVDMSSAYPIMEVAKYPQQYDFPFVTREKWHARMPVSTTELGLPVAYVVIHHSYTPAACYTEDECEKAMRNMQNFHMDDRHWWDIGYNFGVGSDGVAYEGRGWTKVGAHSKGFNTFSLGIVLIGDWTKSTPPEIQLQTAQALIKEGVKLGYIDKNYKVIGHRQVRDTECPGQALFDTLSGWPHFQKNATKEMLKALDNGQNDILTVDNGSEQSELGNSEHPNSV